MVNQKQKWIDCLNYAGRTFVVYMAAWLAMVLCYRAGEVHFLDDKAVCGAFFSAPNAKPVLEEIPYGGEQ